MPPKSSSFRTGKSFGFFDEVDIDGHAISTKKLRGKILVFFFWFTRCSTCRVAIPELNDLAAAYKGNDSVTFIAVAWDKKTCCRNF
jgi:cytochrome oxidase Cu insertion factor (SCO1/SenC/PrrC family)